MAQKVLGTMTDSGSTLTLQGNALRTEDSIVALSNITQIKCVDDTPEYKLPWKLMIVLAVAGLIFFGYVDRAFFMILPGLGCFAGIGYLIYNYMQKKKHRIYALVIEMSAGSYLAYHSDDLNFLNNVKNTIFDAVQNGAARAVYNIDMSNKTINSNNTGSVVAEGPVNGPINNRANING